MEGELEKLVGNLPDALRLDVVPHAVVHSVHVEIAALHAEQLHAVPGALVEARIEVADSGAQARSWGRRGREI